LAILHIRFNNFISFAKPEYRYLAPVTVLEAIQRSTDFLTRKGVDSPRLQAELLLAHLLQMPRLKLYLNFERSLAEREVEQMRDWIKRRGQREPLQQIIGNVCFCGYEINVNREVLIPRPETELLAEHGWEFLIKRVGEGVLAPRILDFGTGSGCLAIVLALKCPQATGLAIDISKEAISMARENAARHQVQDRIEFLVTDGLNHLPEGPRFDLLIANPPYIPSDTIADLQPEVRDFEPRRALDGGPDGLQVIERLATQAGSRLAPDGRIMLEFGDGQEHQVAQIFTQAGWTTESILQDNSKRPRIFIAQQTVS
jgi:release factor glutamine methyltransferase